MVFLKVVEDLLKEETLLNLLGAHKLKVNNSKLYEFNVVEKRKQPEISFPYQSKKSVKET